MAFPLVRLLPGYGLRSVHHRDHRGASPSLPQGTRLGFGRRGGSRPQLDQHDAIPHVPDRAGDRPQGHGASGHQPRRHRPDDDLRFLHLYGHADAGIPGLLRPGRGSRLRRRPAHRPRRRLPPEHQRRRIVLFPSGDVRQFPLGRGGTPTPRRGRRPAGAP